MERDREVLGFHAVPAQDVLRTERSSRSGLSAAEAKLRLAEFGANAVVASPPTGNGEIFLRQFASPFALILLFAVVASGMIGEWFEAGLVVMIVATNGFLGFVQELRANRSLAALRSFLPSMARVRRDGVVATIPSRDLVPGDIVVLALGDRITADCRVLSANAFAIDESVLTGESIPVHKSPEVNAPDADIFERSSMVFAGTSVASGGGECVVTATGSRTQFGAIALRATTAKSEKTPFQLELEQLSRSVAKIAAGLGIVVFVLGLLTGMSWISGATLAAALAVAIVPEGLLVAMTVILAVGMRRMLKRNVLVRSLAAVETLGGVHVICVDKTGTITSGAMQVTELRTGVGVLALDAPDIVSQPLVVALAHLVDDEASSFTTRAIAAMLGELGVSRELRGGRGERPLRDIPFHPSARFSARVFAEDSRRRAFALGAPDALLCHCDATDDELRQAHRAVDDMTSRGLRVLAVLDVSACADGLMRSSELCDGVLLGFVGLSDPMRSSVPAAVAGAALAGVRTIMITGDHPETARAIARQAGIMNRVSSRCVTGAELAAMDDETLHTALLDTAVFARVLPEQKLRIVQALQAQNLVVAMTGDGINDAPALRAADVGIAAPHAADVARDVADVVLLESDFAVIVTAIEEGRAVLENIRKQIGFLLSLSLSETIVVAAAVLGGMPSPLLPLHILWINVLTDSLPSMALAFEPVETGVMALSPRRRGASLVGGRLRTMVLLAAALSSAAFLGALVFLWPRVDEGTVRAVIFTSISLTGIAMAFVFRTFRTPLLTSAPWRNVWLVVLGGGAMLLVLIPLHVPVLARLMRFTPFDGSTWIVVLGFVVLLVGVLDTAKFLIFRRPKRGKRVMIEVNGT